MPPPAAPLDRPAPPGAATVLALHGLTGGGLDFAPLADALPQFGWRAPNLPGHAPDPAAPGAPGDDCRLEAALAYLDTLLAPPPAQTVLLGYSMGGRLALRFALARPGRLAALVLVGVSPGLHDAAARAARRARDLELAQGILARGVGDFLDYWRRRPLIATQARLPAEWHSAMTERRRRLRAAGLAASLRDFGQGALEPALGRLAELRLPVLYAAGRDDREYAALAEEMHDRTPGADLLLVPGAGHMAHLENLPEFAHGLAAFLARHGLGPADFV